MMFGLFTPFFFLPSYAVSRGMSHSLASFLIAILNAASFFGRVIPGVLGDKWGRLNILFAAGVSTAVLICCFTLVKSNASIIVYSILYGFCQGAIISGMTVSISMVPKDQKQMGTYMGMGMAVMSVAVSPLSSSNNLCAFFYGVC
jgi:MFS family permease